MSSQNKSNNKDSNNNIEDQMDAILQLMTKRSNGEATNVQVESAVSEILKNMGAAPPSPPPQQQRPQKKQKLLLETELQRQSIKVDKGNYDDADDDDGDGDNDEHSSNSPYEEEEDTKLSSVAAAATNSVDVDDDDEEYQDQISMVPMGREGTKMMTTFGDGPRPVPKAVEIALLGTRETLQLAIMDARAIRRRAKQTFEEARQTLQRLNTSSLADATSMDPTMMSRALSTHDRLGKTIPCGFDIEQLQALFPEEMRAYQKWNDMYSLQKKSQEEEEEYQSNDGGGDEDVEKLKGGRDNTNDDDGIIIEEGNDTESFGGHIKERAANFDARTEQMKSDWYIKFSQVRQGSFLPNRKKRKTKEEMEWEKLQKRGGKQRGRTKQQCSDWESMTVTSLRFLHWLGFDPPNIKPPNDETTQALAFLGHDMMGRIVEKAIFLRNMKRINSKEQEQRQGENPSILWELKEGEQLSQQDIETALQDPEIQPKPLVQRNTNDTSSKPALQRYFGPGFEERLELEMEELAEAGKKAKLSAEELDFRQEEAALFAKISSPPSILNKLTDLIRNNEEVEVKEEVVEEEQVEDQKEEEETRKRRSKRLCTEKEGK